MSANDEGTKASRRTAPAKGMAAPLTMAGLGPEQVAFLGEATAKNLFVQVLCWPTVPAAWPMLAEAVSALREVRSGLSMSSTVESSSWVHRVAPQLSQPLEREVGAAESTLATLIGRLPVRFAVAIVEHEASERQASEALRYRALFSGCLTAYGTYLKASNQHAIRVMIAPNHGGAQNDLRLAVYGEMLPHLNGPEQFSTIELAFWPKTALPLPLEVAQLAAAAVSRHLQEPTQVNPLFETIRTHLEAPSRLLAPGGRKRHG